MSILDLARRWTWRLAKAPRSQPSRWTSFPPGPTWKRSIMRTEASHQSFPVFFCEQQALSAPPHPPVSRTPLGFISICPGCTSAHTPTACGASSPSRPSSRRPCLSRRCLISPDHLSQPQQGSARRVRHAQPCISCYPIFSHPTSPSPPSCSPLLLCMNQWSSVAAWGRHCYAIPLRQRQGSRDTATPHLY